MLDIAPERRTVVNSRPILSLQKTSLLEGEVEQGGRDTGARDAMKLCKQDGDCEEFWYLVNLILPYAIQFPGGGNWLKKRERLKLHELGSWEEDFL